MSWLRLTVLVVILSVSISSSLSQQVTKNTKSSTRNALHDEVGVQEFRNASKALPFGDKFLALINILRNNPADVGHLLRKRLFSSLCHQFKKGVCSNWSVQLKYYRSMPSWHPSAVMFKVAQASADEESLKKLWDTKKIKADAQKLKKDLKLESIHSKCFWNTTMRNDLPIKLLLTGIIDSKNARKTKKQIFNTSSHHNIRNLFIPHKYKQLVKQKRLRVLQALQPKKKNDFTMTDRLIAGIGIKKRKGGITGCIFVGVMKNTGASKVKSPYDAKKLKILNTFNKFYSEYIALNKMSRAQRLAQVAKYRAEQFEKRLKKLRKNAVVESNKKPVNRKAEM